jgi:hypothetical protein
MIAKNTSDQKEQAASVRQGLAEGAGALLPEYIDQACLAGIHRLCFFGRDFWGSGVWIEPGWGAMGGQQPA